MKDVKDLSLATVVKNAFKNLPQRDWDLGSGLLDHATDLLCFRHVR